MWNGKQTYELYKVFENTFSAFIYFKITGIIKNKLLITNIKTCNNEFKC